MNNTQEPPSPRTLNADIPELKQFLKPGIKILDVGCGVGTITLGVAEAIKPGEVFGIDPFESDIDVAQEWAAQVAHPDNITFQVGDSHQLDFPDNTFDVVYSHTVMHFFLDPLMGLKEQKRVTKSGGWVVASGVRDNIVLRYPPCPNWEKWFEAFRPYFVAHLEEYRASGKDPVTFLEEYVKSNKTYMFYVDFHAGRKCAEWFHNVGLTDVRIAVQPRRVKYQGSEYMQPDIFDALVLDESESELIRQVRATAMRLVDEETIERAKEEVRAWYNEPGAFQFFPEVFAAGRVP